MIKDLINNIDNKKYKSWYDLSFKETKALEQEFIKNDMGRDANKAMHICIVIGVVVFLLATFMLEFMFILNTINPYNFVIMLLFVITGVLIVVISTIEYHSKFNSWLEVKYKIIKK